MSCITLYNLTLEWKEINDRLEESGGELTPELEAALELNHDNFLIKSEGYVETIRKYSDLSAAIDTEIKRLQAYKRTSDNIARNLKERLQAAFEERFRSELLGGEKPQLEVGLHRLSLRRSTYVEIGNEARLPSKYILVETRPDKTLLKEDLNKGIEVPEATLCCRQTLQIK